MHAGRSRPVGAGAFDGCTQGDALGCHMLSRWLNETTGRVVRGEVLVRG
jgi:hypothetical protein